jgi:hypothetical protein
MNPGDPPQNDDRPDEPWNSPGGRTLANAVAIVVIVLAVFVWTDTAAFGTSRELRYAGWFLRIVLALVLMWAAYSLINRACSTDGTSVSRSAARYIPPR